ncbi:MAG: hypothetical protein QN204_04915 [Armatimonadota bacterium]|nr:hypothetical protein [Armatimonadota bacterium]
MSKKTRTTTSQVPDPASQQYLDRLRQAGISAYSGLMSGPPLVEGPDPRPIQDQMAPFWDPYLRDVVGALRAEYDRARGVARAQATTGAIQAGAYGGSRHGVAEGARLAELDRAELSQIGGLLSQGFQSALAQGLGYSEYLRSLRERARQEPLMRAEAGLGLLGGALGPVGSVATEEQRSSPWGTLLGAGLLALGLRSPRAAAAAQPATEAAASLLVPSVYRYLPLQLSPRR